MAYVLKPGSAIGDEIFSVIDKQLEHALDELGRAGAAAAPAAVHEARRHLKKARAAIRLAKPVLLAETLPAVERRLRRASHLLAPIADADAVVQSLLRLRHVRRRQSGRMPIRVIFGYFKRLESEARARAAGSRALVQSAHLIDGARAHVRGWSVEEREFSALAPGLRVTVRKARSAFGDVKETPTVAHFHAWRQRVKDHWLQVRLIEAGCGGALMADERRLETLDGDLGECHNLALLRDVLSGNVLRSRRLTAQWLRVIRREERVLRGRALALGARVYGQRPRENVERVRRAWDATLRHVDAAKDRSCVRAA